MEAVDTLHAAVPEQAGGQEGGADQQVNASALVADNAKSVADSLRSHDVRTSYGQTTQLIPDSAALLAFFAAQLEAASGKPLEELPGIIGPITELLRVFGNLCFDHHDNRGAVLASGVPAILLRVLLRASLALKAAPSNSLVNDDVLKLVKASVGALLNMTLKYAPIQSFLVAGAAPPSTDAGNLSVLLDLLACDGTGLYRPGAWASSQGSASHTQCSTRATIAGWGWTLLEDVLSAHKSALPASRVSALLGPILAASPSPKGKPASWDEKELSDVLETEVQILTTAAGVLESVILDTTAPGAKLQLVSDGRLASLCEWIETSAAPAEWSWILEEEEDDGDGQAPPAKWDAPKAFANLKSSVVRALVECSNDDAVKDAIWGDQAWQEQTVGRFARWLQDGVASAAAEPREDLLVCATHFFAGLARSDEICIALLATYGLLQPLTELLAKYLKLATPPPAGTVPDPKSRSRPGEATQVLFGILSLARHLSIPQPNKLSLGECGILEGSTFVLGPSFDVALPVQTSSIGLLKQLTSSCLPNCLALLGPDSIASTLSSTPTPLDLILALLGRTDDLRLRSEGTRVLCNLVRSLFSTRAYVPGESAIQSPVTPFRGSTAPPPSALALGVTPGGLAPLAALDEMEVIKRRVRGRVVRPEVGEALAALMRGSEKWPLLVNEAVVALTLLAGSGAQGACIVLDSLLITVAPPVPATEPGAGLAPLLEAPEEEEGLSSPLSPAATTPSATSAASAARRVAKRKASQPAAAEEAPASSGVELITRWLNSATIASSTSSSAPMSPAGSGPRAQVRPEMIGNLLALLLTVLRGAEVAKADAAQLEKLREALKEPVRKLLLSAGEKEGTVKKTATRLAEVLGL